MEREKQTAMDESNQVIKAINEMRRIHHEDCASSDEEPEPMRATEIIIEKAGKKTKRNFPFELDWFMHPQ